MSFPDSYFGGQPFSWTNLYSFLVKNKKGGKIGPRERLASKVGVRKTHYREDKACNMLHLSDKKRLDMGKSCLKFFMYIYKIIIRNESRA